MKALAVLGTACAVAIAAVWCSASPARAGAKDESARAAAKIVEETLQREAQGGLPDRSELLQPALKLAPEYGPARWPSGFVYHADRREWLRPDAVAQAAAEDSRLAAYRRARQKCPATVEGHAELARWCDKRKLDDQARAHWTQVLQWNPEHQEAMRQLGLRVVQGNLVADSDLAEAKAYLRKASGAAAKWGPRLERLRDRLAGKNARQREKAREDLLAIDDPDAVESIDAVLCRPGGDMALLGIEALGKIRCPQAGAALACHVVRSPWPAAREGAARALRNQDKYYYVPLLLDAMKTPIATGPQWAAKSDGAGGTGDTRPPSQTPTPIYGRPRTVYRLDRHVSTHPFTDIVRLTEHPLWYESPQTPLFDPKSPNRVASPITSIETRGTTRITTEAKQYYEVRNDRLQTKVTQGTKTVDKQVAVPVGAVLEISKAQVDAYKRQMELARYNSMVNAHNAAIAGALAEATGVTKPSSPSEWWDWWYEDNEVYVPSEKPRRAANPPDPAAEPAAGTDAQRGDCPVGATLVHAETGPMPVEKVAVGDRLFACDPETGRVALKPVLRVTIRPEGRLLRIRAGGEEFQASGGHVFWVAGRAWVKARQLAEGMHLHTLRGTVAVEALEPGAVEKTYGILTADFHTFFAGKAAVLTHDNTVRPPTDRVVPGLAAR